jgi:putative FmdB family regulatory protein
MPIYEYICSTCGIKFDALRSMKDADSPISCKQCQSNATHRALSTCFAHSDGHAVAGASGGCGGSCGSCSSGSCGCGHH